MWHWNCAWNFSISGRAGVVGACYANNLMCSFKDCLAFGVVALPLRVWILPFLPCEKMHFLKDPLYTEKETKIVS